MTRTVLECVLVYKLPALLENWYQFRLRKLRFFAADLLQREPRTFLS